MPIANCFLNAGCHPFAPEAVVRRWAEASGIASDEMTINIVESAQGGSACAVMAWLYLPSVWSGDDVAALQEGLAVALVATADVDVDEVQVITTIVPSGLVVERGRTRSW